MRAPDRSRLVVVLTALVVLGSLLVLVLALTKPDSDTVGAVAPTLDSEGHYVPADFAAPAGPALAAATTTVRRALTYDYRSLDAGRKAAQRGMTPAFARRYAAAFRTMSAPFVRRKEVADAEIAGAGVVRVAGGSTVRCLLVVDQRLLTSTASAQPGGGRIVSRNRVLVDVVKHDGTWLVANIAPVR